MIGGHSSRAVAITGRGAVSALGADCAALWDGVTAGTCGIHRIARFDTSAFSVATGAQVVSGALRTAAAVVGDVSQHALTESLCLELASRALREALRDARLWDHVAARAATTHIALVFGTGLGELTRPLHEIADALANEVGLDGIRLTISTACSSSTTAIGLGHALIAMQAADIVVAGGADVLTPEVFAGFHALGVLSPTRCAPFSTPAGTTLGEGAGFLVLEPAGQAPTRGAEELAWLAGFGLSCDAWHETSPDPKGTGIERSISAAIGHAGIDPATLDYVNAHGSGTQANDGAEWLGIRRALGARADAVPVSSTKGALGHAQGAAGVLEAIVTMEAMRHGMIPPTLNFSLPRPFGPPDPVAGDTPRPCHVDRAVSVNAAFGGANAAIVITRAPTPIHASVRRVIRLRGLGALSAADIAAFDPRTEDARISPDELRRCDPSSRALTVACARALRAAGYRCTGEQRGRTGLFVGQIRPSPASTDAFVASIASNGLPQLSASAFARVVLNAAAGTCARLLSLRGPHTVLTTGATSGLTALVLAAEHLAFRDDLDAIVAGAVDEEPPRQSGGDHAIVDAAICALLIADTGAPDVGADGCDLFVSGWGIAPATESRRAVTLAAPSGLPPGTTRFIHHGAVGACASLHPLVDAVRALQAGDCDHALVTSTTPGAASAALLLTRRGQ